MHLCRVLDHAAPVLASFFPDECSFAACSRRCRCLAHYDKYFCSCAALDPVTECRCTSCDAAISCKVERHVHHAAAAGAYCALVYDGLSVATATNMVDRYAWIPSNGIVLCRVCCFPLATLGTLVAEIEQRRIEEEIEETRWEPEFEMW